VKKVSKIYYVLTYLFFIYPPFIAGLVLIYREGSQNMHIYGLIGNVVVLLLLLVTIAVLISMKKLHMPTEREIRYLIFGLIGNIVMFLYTFQNIMHISHIITIYLVLLVVLSVHYFLISKKLQPLELWIFLPIYLVFDTLYFGIKGCTYTSSYNCYESSPFDSFLFVLFTIILVFMFLYILYKLLSYRQHTILKYINYLIVLVLSIFALGSFNAEIKIILTFAISLPFFIILDFIVSIINKSYTHKTILFYIRTSMVIFICSLFGFLILSESELQSEALSLFVVGTYISLGISILKTLLRIEVKDISVINLFKKGETIVKYSICTKEDIKSFESTFTNYLDRMKFSDDEYNMKVVKGEDVLGLLHSDCSDLDPAIGVTQAHIYFIEVAENPFELTNGLLYQVERYYKSKGVQQIKYLAHLEESDIIQLLMKRGYIPVDIEKKGFYIFIKSL